MTVSRNQVVVDINAVDKTAPAVASATASMNKMTRATQQANTAADRAARQMRAGYQQLGYQIQDVSVQLQMGTSPFIVFAQQGSQIASIFGAGGAVVGAVFAVAAALGMVLAPALFKGTTALADMKKAAEEADKAFKEAEPGVVLLGDAIMEMAKASSAAATIELRRLRDDLIDNLQSTKKAFAAELGDFGAEIQAVLDDQLAMPGSSSSVWLTDKYGIAAEDLTMISATMSRAINGSNEDIDRFLTLLSALQNEGGVTDAFNEFAEAAARYATEIVNGGQRIQEYEERLVNLGDIITATGNASDKASRKSADSVEDMIKKLQHQALTYDMSATQIAVYDAILAGANVTQLTTIQQLSQEIEARERLKELAATEAKAIEDGYKAQMDALKVIGREQSEGLTGTDKIAADFDERIRITYEALQELGWMETEHANLLIQLNQQKAAAVAKSLYEEEEARRQTVQSQISLMQGMASSIASSLEEGTAVQKAAYLVSQGLAFADAIISAELASAKALALFPQNPAYAGMIKAMGYASAGVIAGQTIGSFEGGGFTGYGARAGGIDGRGGMPAIVHPNETIIDHTKGGGATNVYITIQANDTRGFDELLNKRRGMIASMVQSSLNNSGRRI
jgi:hypothetical protein